MGIAFSVAVARQLLSSNDLTSADTTDSFSFIFSHSILEINYTHSVPVLSAVNTRYDCASDIRGSEARSVFASLSG